MNRLDLMKEKLESFIEQNRKICWESEYENDEYCIGENKVRQFFESNQVQAVAVQKIAVEYRDGWVIVLRVKGDATISYPKENVGNFINDLNKALRGERLSTLS